MENLELRVEICKNVKERRCLFTDHFRGFEKVDVVKRIFGDAAAETLTKLAVEFTKATLYMRVDNFDGHLMINPEYFLNADISDIYLDIVHELVHVKQFLEGKISDQDLNYVERPLEIEAYKITVDEARAIGISENRIFDYLDSDLLSSEELKQLAGTIGVDTADYPQ